MYTSAKALRKAATKSPMRPPKPAITRIFHNRRDYDRLMKQPDYLIRDVGLTREQLNRARDPWSLLLGAIF